MSSSSCKSVHDDAILQNYQGPLKMSLEVLPAYSGHNLSNKQFPDLLLVSELKYSYDGNSDNQPLRSILKKPEIPPRNSSLHAFNRSRSSENLKLQATANESPPPRASSISLPSGVSRSPSIPPTVPGDQPGNQQVEQNKTQSNFANFQTPKFITPLSTPYVAPQTSLQPTIATPVLIMPENQTSFDFATTMEDGRVRRVSTGSIDPFTEEEMEEDYQFSAKEVTKDLLGASTDSRMRRDHHHVGWKSDFLTLTIEENIGSDSETYGRRRSNSLPDIPGVGGGRPLKTVKGRRATPWVHNIGIDRATAGNGKDKRVRLAFPTLKRISDASVKSTWSGHEVWFDALEEQKKD